LRAGRNQQEIARFLKRAQVPGLPFEECFEPKPGCWLATQNNAKITQGWLKANLKDHWSKEIWPTSSKLTQKRSFGLIRTVDFEAWPLKT
jgi:hypothetical protein